MRRYRASLIFAVALAQAGVAVASEAHASHAAGIPWGTLAFQTINLSIFLWVLARFAFPAIRRWVQDRRTQLIAALEEAAAAKAEALRLQQEWESRMASLENTIEQLRREAREDAERERDRLLAAAQKTAEAIRRDAERAAGFEVRRVRDQLRADLVREAVQVAEAEVRAGWTPADQDRVVADFLRQVHP